MKTKPLILSILCIAFFCVPGIGDAQTKKEAAEPAADKDIVENIPMYFEKNDGQYDQQVRYASGGLSNTLFLTSSEAVLSLHGKSKKDGTKEDEPVVDVAEPIVDKADIAKRPLSADTQDGQNGQEVKKAAPESSPGLSPDSKRPATLGLPRERKLRDKKALLDRLDKASKARVSEPPRVLRMQLSGNRSADVQVEGLDEQEGKSNYFVGNNSNKWQTNVKHFGRVKYSWVYPGIDLVFYGGQQSTLEYDFIVSPGADYRQIKLHFEGANKLELDQQGNLVLDVDGVVVTQHKPHVYQTITGRKKNVTGEYLLLGEGNVAFGVGEYDRSMSLIIDPVLVYSTYLGGPGYEEIMGIGVDAEGSAYVTGITDSVSDFPASNLIQPSPTNVQAVFIVKLNPTGKRLRYSTVIRGTYCVSPSYCSSGVLESFIAVDSDGYAYIAGYTGAVDFPMVEAVQPTYGGHLADAFVAKLNRDGDQLIFSTYLGGSSGESVGGFAGDAYGNSYVVGSTSSDDFPVSENPLPLQGEAFETGGNAFVVKLDSAGKRVYSTYLGGRNKGALSSTSATAVAADNNGCAYVTGHTSSSMFPKVDPIQETGNIFISKIKSDGSALVYSTLFGVDWIHDFVTAIAVDSLGNAYIAGDTSSSKFPTKNTRQALNGFQDCFITKINAQGNDVEYSTYLGGSGGGEEIVSDLSVDGDDNLYVCGYTQALDFPVKNPFQDRTLSGYSGFVTKIHKSGAPLLFSTYFSAPNPFERITSVAVDQKNNIYIAGRTDYEAFRGLIPTKHAYQRNPGGGVDGFVAKFGETFIYLR
jgi:hypothetical protein